MEKATERGVCAIQLVTTDYTNQQAVRQDRLEAIAREAAEQTERFDLPLIREPISLDLLLEQVSGTLVHADESLARPDVYPPEAEASDHAQPALNLPATVLIGPEGGFSPTERARLLAHPRGYRLSLGPRILRAETAAIAALTIVQSRCGDWGHGN